MKEKRCSLILQDWGKQWESTVEILRGPMCGIGERTRLRWGPRLLSTVCSGGSKPRPGGLSAGQTKEELPGT